MSEDRLKLYCIVNAEALAKMNGNRGKLAAQAGHAFLHSFWDATERFPEAARAYKDSGLAFKITLVVPTEAELRDLVECYRATCGVSLVTDAARTVFLEPTVTCLGLGPIRESEIGASLKALPVLI